MKWATIGPNYEYGKRAWETFRDRLKQLKPDVQVVGEHWPTLGKLEAGAFVTAILNQNPEALYVSLFGRDWLAFVREAQKRGLFQKMFVVGILLGEPEYIDPAQARGARGHAGHRLPVVRRARRPRTRSSSARFHEEVRQATPCSARWSATSPTSRSSRPSARRAATDTDKMVAAFRGLKVETPIGPITYRASDGQSTMGAWVGTTKLDAKRGVGVMVNHEYVPGETVLPSDDEVKKMRSGN